jgi:hypothetical protein
MFLGCPSASARFLQIRSPNKDRGRGGIYFVFPACVFTLKIRPTPDLIFVFALDLFNLGNYSTLETTVP